jgi:hypothetical protein
VLDRDLPDLRSSSSDASRGRASYTSLRRWWSLPCRAVALVVGERLITLVDVALEGLHDSRRPSGTLFLEADKAIRRVRGEIQVWIRSLLSGEEITERVDLKLTGPLSAPKAAPRKGAFRVSGVFAGTANEYHNILDAQVDPEEQRVDVRNY